jgi:predicted nucleic acid-binding protein
VATFVDTSALFSLLDTSDPHRPRALDWFERATADPDEHLVTHNYVVVESVALAHRRLGPDAARVVLEDVVPVLVVEYVDEDLHRRATSAFLAAVRRRPSLVDWVSFELMRDRDIDRAFAFDRDFGRQGFDTVP